MADELDGFFEEETTPEAEPAEAEVPTGEVETKGEEEPTTPVDEESKADKGVIETMRAERRKRQASEQQVQELQSKLDKLEGETDIFDDPNGFIDQKLDKVRKESENRFLSMSEHQANARYDDFEEKKANFFDIMAKANPALTQEAINSPDPYDYIYNASKQQMEIASIGDLSTYRERLTAEITADLAKGGNPAIEAAIKKKLELPGTLATERAAGGNANPEFAQPSAESLYD
ncbi:hypothetical protein KAR91_12860 [Candidatus Pacearchaeota archaeon]|nr:hypothetical protein [Candidatus Pacearchaeota archaeon]